MGTLRDGVMKRSNTWSFVIRLTDERTGVSKPKWAGGFATEAAAKEARDSARVAARQGVYVDRSRITVTQYLDDWLDAHALEIKPATLSTYRYLVTHYVNPHIGRMRLQAVWPTTLSGLYRELLVHGGKEGRPLSRATVDYVHAILRKAFNDAVRSEQLLVTNPAERAKRPRGAPPRPSRGLDGRAAPDLPERREPPPAVRLLQSRGLHRSQTGRSEQPAVGRHRLGCTGASHQRLSRHHRGPAGRGHHEERTGTPREPGRWDRRSSACPSPQTG